MPNETKHHGHHTNGNAIYWDKVTLRLPLREMEQEPCNRLALL